MPQKTTEQILNELFSKVNNVILPIDPDQSTPPMGFVTLMLPGVTVHAQDFDPATSVGRENLYRTMDRLPAVNKHYLDSGRSCSDMYQRILAAQLPADDPEKAAAMKQEYDQAQALLSSSLYKQYKNCRADYYDAEDDYLRAQNDPDMEDRDCKMSQAKQAMDDAMKDWIGIGRKGEIEDALATCARYLAFTPKAFFANAGMTFAQAKNSANGLYPVVCTPSDWATDPDQLSWTEVVIKQGSSESRLHSDTKQIDSDFSVSFSSGPWRAGASGGYHDKAEKLNTSSKTDKLGMSFEIARVNINRDWFSSALLTFPGTTIPGAKRGSLCSGSLATADKCDFPFLPTAFVVARNIKIYNEFSQEEEQFLNEAKSWSASAKVSYGPFSLGNDTASSHDLTKDEKDTFGSAAKMTVGSGMQIIGFLNTILSPAFPAEDSDRTSLEHLTAFGDFLLCGTN